MRHEKIFRREDGSRCKVIVEFHHMPYREVPLRWNFYSMFCPPKKRTWKSLVNHDDYAWRRLTADDRQKEDHRRSLLVATKEEVMETMLELWQKMKPPEIAD